MSDPNHKDSQTIAFNDIAKQFNNSEQFERDITKWPLPDDPVWHSLTLDEIISIINVLKAKVLESDDQLAREHLIARAPQIQTSRAYIDGIRWSASEAVGRLNEDCDLTQLAREWPSLSDCDRIIYLQRLHTYMVTELGIYLSNSDVPIPFPNAKVLPFSDLLSNEEAQARAGGFICSIDFKKDNKVTLHEISENSFIYMNFAIPETCDDFGDAINTLCHETSHYMDHCMGLSHRICKEMDIAENLLDDAEKLSIFFRKASYIHPEICIEAYYKQLVEILANIAGNAAEHALNEICTENKICAKKMSPSEGKCRPAPVGPT